VIIRGVNSIAIPFTVDGNRSAEFNIIEIEKHFHRMGRKREVDVVCSPHHIVLSAADQCSLIDVRIPSTLQIIFGLAAAHRLLQIAPEFIQQLRDRAKQPLVLALGHNFIGELALNQCVHLIVVVRGRDTNIDIAVVLQFVAERTANIPAARSQSISRRLAFGDDLSLHVLIAVRVHVLLVPRHSIGAAVAVNK